MEQRNADPTAPARVTETVEPSSPEAPPTIWPTVRYPDPQAAIDFLVATFGFEPTALIPGDQPGTYAEIELRWPHGSGGIIIADSADLAPSWLYIVTPDPDALYERSKAAGLEITRELTDTDYGSRTFSTVDPWSNKMDLRHLPRQLRACGLLRRWRVVRSAVLRAL